MTIEVKTVTFHHYLKKLFETSNSPMLLIQSPIAKSSPKDKHTNFKKLHGDEGARGSVAV